MKKKVLLSAVNPDNESQWLQECMLKKGQEADEGCKKRVEKDHIT